MTTIERVLIANRGEIACRVARTCRRLGIETVAVYSDVDADALHVRSCDAAVHLPGNAPADTYLRVDLLLDAARRSGADAVHPGYGFLAESAPFAAAVIDAGLTWIGPPPSAISSMGSKIEAKAMMRAAGVPVLPDSTVESDDEIGFPMLVKASAGGGGRGMRIVRRPDELSEARAAAEREAASAFGDGTVFCERFVERGRHIEIQVFADGHGNVASLHERECSIQRRHQKIVEECPSPAVGPELRRRMSEAACEAARAVDYQGAGTVEFLLAPDDSFAFLEMNTRLQVEHPVTEAVTGLDLVELQIAVAEGSPLPAAALVPALNGHAIEVRLTAEDPGHDYRPATGTFTTFEVAADGAVRVDTGVESGSVISPYYDSMVAKVIAHGPTRRGAIRSLRRALTSARLHGPVTNRVQLVRILDDDEFRAGDVHTGFLDDDRRAAAITGDRGPALAALVITEAAAQRARARALADIPTGWRNNPSADQYLDVIDGGDGDEATRVGFRFGRRGELAELRVDGADVAIETARVVDAAAVVVVDGLERRYMVGRSGDLRIIDGPDGHRRVRIVPRHPAPQAASAAGSLSAPMPGAVLRILATANQAVVAGEPLMVIEAMKMEHQIVAPRDGIVAEVWAAVGDQVESGQVLLVVDGSG
ncbi:MAG: acetyl/propionyl/methylcrotonyl-CoA carboxylase subunit alpha [Desertimonas sp.]